MKGQGDSEGGLRLISDVVRCAALSNSRTDEHSRLSAAASGLLQTGSMDICNEISIKLCLRTQPHCYVNVRGLNADSYSHTNPRLTSKLGDLFQSQTEQATLCLEGEAISFCFDSGCA